MYYINYLFGTNDINICMNIYYVYIYYDPITNLPFYVGKGKGNRLLHHLNETIDTTDNRKKFNYINKLRKLGLSPKIVKFKENLSEEEAYNLERDLISEYGRNGFEDGGLLTNICIDARPPVTFGPAHHNYGRPVITKHTEETKKKISESKKGKESWHKGKRKSAETKQKMSLAQKGRVVPDSAKEKLKQYIQEKNSQFGSMWITNGTKNMKIKKDSTIPEGWIKGRTFKDGYKHVRN